METLAFQVANGAFQAAQKPQSLLDRKAHPFSTPSSGHICDICQSIPAELFIGGSDLLSQKCRGHRPPGTHCMGKHSITCDGCGEDIEGIHANCSICNDGHYDLCEKCLDQGKHCSVSEHRVEKRIFKDNMIRPLDGFEMQKPEEVDEKPKEVAEKPAEPIEAKSESDDDEAGRDKLAKALHEAFPFHPNFAALTKSAQSGCHACSVIRSMLPEDLSKPETGPLFLQLRPVEVPPDWQYVRYMSKMFLEESDLDADADWGMPALVLSADMGQGEIEPLFPLCYDWESSKQRAFSRQHEWISKDRPTQISPVIEADGNLSIIADWIDECVSNHDECPGISTKAFLPTRLIDCGSPDIVAPPRLVERTDLPDGVTYLTLSYCWGQLSETPWITKKSNLDDFKVGLVVEKLPKTISDAIHVARAIGRRYLWVDSICIVQDDYEDWSREAKVMGDIYQNSVLTLISGTDSAHGGLFLPREELQVTAARMNPKYVCQDGQISVTLYPCLKDIDLSTGPTIQRAWCFQEELLSRRRLYFTAGQFVWLCEDGQRDEVGRKCPGDRGASDSYSTSQRPIGVPFSNSTVVGEWFDMVKEYTSRSLTFEADLFPALGSIARQLQKKYEDRYLAGMWERDMISGLLWHRNGNTVARPTSHKVPTWSWFGVKGRVVFERDGSGNSVADAEVLGHKIQTCDGDDYSRVLPGSTITLRARLLDCVVKGDTSDDPWEKCHNAYQTPKREEVSNNRQEVEEEDEEENEEDEEEDEEEGGKEDKGEEENEEDVEDDNQDESSQCISNDGEAELIGQPDAKHGCGEEGCSGDCVLFSSGPRKSEEQHQVIVSAPWEASPPAILRPAADRLDLAASVATRADDRTFGVVFFDGEVEIDCKEIQVAFMAHTERPGDLIDRNGLALVQQGVDEETKLPVYKRIGFVAFWDKILGDDVEFLTSQEKVDFIIN